MNISERRKNRPKGYCSECAIRPAVQGRKRCKKCIDADEKRKAALPAKPKNICQWRGCSEAVLPGKRLCEKHFKWKKDYMYDYIRDYKRKQRAKEKPSK